MQTGRNIVDAAVLAQTGYVAAGYGAPFFSADTREASQVLKDGGTQLGWTDEGISESILDLPNAIVRNGRLAPDGPNFKALVIEGDVAFSRAHLPARRDRAEAARLGARQGLPIVIVGDWRDPDRPRASPSPARTPQLKASSTQLLAAADGAQRRRPRDLIPVALDALGVQRDVEYSRVQPVQTAHRVDGAKDYYLHGQHPGDRQPRASTRRSR